MTRDSARYSFGLTPACLRYTAGILLLFAAHTAHAAQYGFEVWTAENGLPQNTFRGLAQTPDGFLWIATLDGLVRFDGVRFTTFDKANTAGISSNRFRSMIQDPDGDLWLDTESGGLTRYHRGFFHTYSAEEGIPNNGVLSISHDANGAILLQTTESIARWNKASGELKDTTPENLRTHAELLQWDNAGFWGFDASGLHLFVNGHSSDYLLPSGITRASIWRAGLAEDGAVWIETQDGRQFVYSAGRNTAEIADPDHPRRCTYRDIHGHIWNLHVGRRLQRFLDFESSGKMVSVPFDCFYEDREGNAWVGTTGSGLYRLQREAILVYSEAQGLIDKNIYPVFQDRSGDVWIGAWSSGLSRFRDGRVINYSDSNGLPNRLVTALAEDRDGNLWVGLYDRLALFRDGHFRTPQGIALPSHSVPQAIMQDRGGTIWIGTSNGLVIYRDGPSKTLTVEDGLATNDVRTIIESPSGDIWIGGYGGLTRLQHGQLTRWTERDGLPSDNIRALFLDTDGVLWIGTYDGGLGRMKDGKLTRYAVQNGLFSNGVFQILDDERGNLWMSCNRGIFRVSKSELNAFAEGQRPSVDSVSYGRSDGMLNVECNGGLWPAGIKTQDGKLWFPTQDGVAVIDPKAVTGNSYPPPVVIESLLLDRRPVGISGPVRVPPNTENLEIAYTALSFIRSGQIRFRYKMEGLDSNWIEAGSRRTAYYSHLPPGTYQFHVIASNSDGVWNYVGQTIPFEIQAPFYLTWWFTMIEIVIILGIAAMILRHRFAQFEKRQAAQKAFAQQLITSQESERRRIAAELHDSLGQRLTVINNLALFSLRDQASDGDGFVKYGSSMQEISSEAMLAIAETREISYNLRPFQLDVLGLTKAVEHITRIVGAASGMHVTSSIENIDDVFPEDLRINFYRIVQESLNNAIKHSKATKAYVSISRNGGHVILSIRDNGIGFTPKKRTSGETSGFGTTGMTERARSLGGSFHLRSAPGEGTVVTVEIPGREGS